MASRMVSSELAKTEKLNATNFVTWKRRIRHILFLDDLGHVLDQVVEPTGEQSTTAQKREYEKFRMEDARARTTMLTFMEPTMELLFEKHKTAKEMYEAIERRYGEHTEAHIRLLHTRYTNMRMEEGKNVLEHINAMTIIASELEMLGDPISLGVQVSTILTSLPPSWEAVVVALNLSDKKLTLDDLTAKLGLEQERREHMRASNASANLAHHVGSKKGGSYAGTSKKNFKRKGKKPQFQGGDKAKNKKKGACFTCGQMGHFSRNCPNGSQGNEKKKQQGGGKDIVCMISEALIVNTNTRGWWLDSAATRHVAMAKESFAEMKEISPGEHKIYMGNNTYCDVLGIGSVRVPLLGGNTLVLTDVLYAPTIRRNLISIPLLTQKGFEVRFKGGKGTVGQKNNILFTASLVDGLFKLDVSNDFANNEMIDSEYVACVAVDNALLWHLRLCHVNATKLHRMSGSGLLPRISDNLRTCEDCLSGKMTRLPFPKGQRAIDLLEVIHSDICGPINVKTQRGMMYFITFIDDYSRYGYVYLLSRKSDALEKFKEFKAEVENQLGRKIKVLRTDRGGEYTSDLFKDYCTNQGIVHQYTLPYTPQQNGVAERRNRTLMDMVRSMLNHSELGTQFWGEALDTAVYVLNRIPSKSIKLTPYELWTGRRPNFSNLRVWGSKAHVRVPDQLRTKLDPKTIKCNFIGYCDHSKGYRFVVHHDDGTVGVIESRDAYFLEEDIDLKTPSQKVELFEIEKEKVTVTSNEQVIGNTSNEDVETRASRERRPSILLKDYYAMLGEDEISIDEPVLSDPVTFEQAMCSPDSKEWQKAVQEEMDSILKNKVWEIVDLPDERKPIGCKWIFKKKLKADGSIEKYKARLVAKGFTQVEGIDFKETYSPVSRFISIRCLLAIVSYLDLELHQMDVKTAFLNGDLEEEIYMEQPEGFVVSGEETKVCKLIKSLYGLKQSPRQWYFTFHKVISEYGFVANDYDHCVYSFRDGSRFMILSLYVDDILLMGNDTSMILSLKEWLKTQFEMKDMGEASYILGMKIERDRKARRLSISQESYIESVLKRFDVIGWKTIDSPIYKGTVLSERMAPASDEERLKMQSVPYAQAIGSLMYAMNCTRPDLAFVVSLVSRYQANPGMQHWQAIKRVFRYLLGTKDMKLTYQAENLSLEGYSDSDYAGCKDDRKSTAGYVFMLGGGAVAWASKKQKCVTKSTMEAEFVACSLAASEAVWIKEFLAGLQLEQWTDAPVQIYCDNLATVSTLRNGEISSRAKHIEVHYFYVFDMLQRGKLTVSHLPTVEMLADPLTKALTTDLFVKHVHSFGLRQD